MDTCSRAPSMISPMAVWGSRSTAAQVLEGQKVNLLLKRGQQEYVFPTQVARVWGEQVGLQLMPLTTKQHIDFVQCTFARADTWALWQDSYPEDKPLESLLDILKLGFRGYRHLAEFSRLPSK